MSVNKLTSDNIHIVLVMSRCGKFVGGCTILGLAECSNFLVHCRLEKHKNRQLPKLFWILKP